MKRWWQRPLLHFLLLGSLLFAAERGWSARQPEPITVDAAWVTQLREDWRRETGRWPTLAELQASLARRLDEERLLQAALDLGLETRDPVARLRLLDNLRFALDTHADDEALLLEAQRLQLAARDLVVRRRLVQVMEDRLLQPQLPSGAELDAYIRAHPQRYAAPARYRFEQRYFREDAAARQALQQGEPPAGEAFLLGTRFESLSLAEVRKQMGADFAGALATAPAGQWSGPVRSPYGAHLVFVHAVIPGQPPETPALRMQAAYAWLAEHAPQRLQAALAPLRQRYPAALAPELLALGLRA